ncbi:unnamed protein product [Larinioides sclopetarius]|uniref:Uncharacterized protein n=1 Tax=Larinioides sclopetarius TaxID=280406 RepID=A0AAV2B395_9ARAC
MVRTPEVTGRLRKGICHINKQVLDSLVDTAMVVVSIFEDPELLRGWRFVILSSSFAVN